MYGALVYSSTIHSLCFAAPASAALQWGKPYECSSLVQDMHLSAGVRTARHGGDWTAARTRDTVNAKDDLNDTQIRGGAVTVSKWKQVQGEEEMMTMRGSVVGEAPAGAEAAAAKAKVAEAVVGKMGLRLVPCKQSIPLHHRGWAARNVPLATNWFLCARQCISLATCPSEHSTHCWARCRPT